jgi:hypothetical protein
MSVTVVQEVSIYDAFPDSFMYEEVKCGDCVWKVVNIKSSASSTNSLCDANLAATLTQQPSLLPSDNAAKVLVLNCGAGCAGVAALQLIHREVAFLGESQEKLLNVWKNIALNATDRMASARCFSTDGVRRSALGCSS